MAYLDNIYKIHRGTQANDGKGTPARTAAEGLNQNADRINSALEEINNRITSVSEDIYLQISKEVLEAISTVEGLETSITEAVRDGVIDLTEAANIGRYLENLENDKADIDGRFSTLHSSEYLTDDQKDDLAQAKNAYDSSHYNLVVFIQLLVNEGKVTDSDETELTYKFEDYRASLTDFTEAYETAYNQIAEARIDAIVVGTRNLLLDSKNLLLDVDGDYWRISFSATSILFGSTNITWSREDMTFQSGIPNVSSELLEGDHIVSVDVESDISQAITLRLSDGMNTSERLWELEAGRKTRVYVHLKAAWNNKVLDFEIQQHTTGGNLEISGLKLAQGNKSDSYTPAPEDIENRIEETRQNVTEAYEAYAEAEAQRKALETQAWTDGKLSRLEETLLADATAKANAARRYAEAQDVLLEVLTNAYTDGKITALESELIDLAEDNLTAAKGYVDAQIILEQVRSDAYIDQEIATERQRAIDDAQQKYNDAIAEAETLSGAARDAAIADAQNKYDAAVSHANAQAALAQANAIAHADGVVSDEEAARIAALQDYEAAAQAYADAAQQLAETNAAAYADGVISDEEAERIAQAEANLLEAKQHATSLADALDLRIDGQNDYILQVAEDNLTAAKNYAEAQDDLLDTALKAYADGIVSDAEARAMQDASEKADAAKAYADAQDLLLDTALKSYADGEISDLEASLLAIAQSNAEAAEAYVNAQIALEETRANAYADGVAEQAELDAIAEAEAQMQLAKDYADAQDALLDTAIKAYADGEISAAEARAIADAEAKVAAVQASLDTLQSDLEGEIDDINSRISTLETVTLAALEDGILDEMEIADLRVEKRMLDKEKKDVDARYQIIIGNPHLEGPSRTDLIASENSYQSSYSALSAYYEDIFTTGEIPPGDPSALIQAYTDSLADFSAHMAAALESISQKKADLAELDAIQAANNRLDNEVLPAIDDVQAATDALQFITEDSFWDGKLEEYEIQAIQTHIEPLLSEKADLYSKYAVVYTNEFLKDPYRENLYQAYDAYDDASTDLIYAIENIETVGTQGVTDAFDAHRTALDNLRTAFEEAADAIDTERIDGILIGTRNLLLDSREISLVQESSDTLSLDVTSGEITFASTEITWDREDITFEDGIPNISSLELTGQFSFGVNVSVPSQRVVRIEITDKVAPYTTKAREHLVPAGQSVRIGAVGEGKPGNTGFTIKIITPNISQLSYKELKLETGNKWTDYNQAPEDVFSLIDIAKNNAQQAAEAYAKAEAERAALEAKAHADGKISQMEQKLLNHADAVANAARRYSQAQDTHLQILLEAYADGEIDALETELIDLSNSNLAAAEAAAIAAANAAQTAAEAYADGEISEMESTLMNYADNAADAAQTYADAADVLLKGTLEAYADGVVSAEEAARIAALQAYESAAQDYADAAAEAERLAAEAYADGEISEMESTLMNYADNAASAAEQAAIAADNALQGVLEAYADGVVSAEEQARINALQAYADAAESYADAAAEAAEIAAKAHADGEITDAEARAIADATAKMNDAKDHADQLFGDLQDQVDDVSANAQQAMNVASELAQNLDAFGTKIGDNTIITGAVEVGSPTGGANAGISGVTDQGVKSVRFYAGESYSNKTSSPFRVLDDGSAFMSQAYIQSFLGQAGVRINNGALESYSADGQLRMALKDGVMESYDNNGVKRMEWGFNQTDGVPIFNVYKETSELVLTFGPGGINYVGYIEESYSTRKFIHVSSDTSPTAAQLEPIIKQKLEAIIVGGTNFPHRHTAFGEYTMYSIVGKESEETTVYTYSAGNNLETENNRQYEGYYYLTKNKLSTNYLATGWYVAAPYTHQGIIYEGHYDADFDGNDEYHSGAYAIEITAIRIVDGVIGEHQQIIVPINGIITELYQN